MRTFKRTKKLVHILENDEISEEKRKRMIEKKRVDVNEPDDRNCTPLFYAAKMGYLRAIEVLVMEFGANVNMFSEENGATPLHMAVWKDHIEGVVLLVKLGADMEKACSEKGGDDNAGTTALHWAVASGNMAAVVALLNAGADVNRQDAKGNTPICWASALGRAKIIALLVQSGADVNIATNTGQTPLHLSAMGGHAEAALELIRAGVNVEARNCVDQTALLLACSNGHSDCLALLMREGAVIDNCVTPLHMATKKGYIACISTLIEAGVDTNVRDERHETPLHCAVKNGDLEAIKLLIEAGADLNVANRRSRTPLFMAAFTRHSDWQTHYNTVKLLLEAGAHVNCVSESGCAPLHVIARQNDVKLLDLLLHYGADINVRDGKNRTVVMEAARDSAADALTFLVRKGADLGDRNAQANLLLAAARMGASNAIEALVESGVDLNVRYELGQTPLHLAARVKSSKSRDTIRTLACLGVDLNAKDANGRTATYRAALDNSSEALITLIQYGAEMFHGTEDFSNRKMIRLCKRLCFQSQRETSLFFALLSVRKVMIVCWNRNIIDDYLVATIALRVWSLEYPLLLDEEGRSVVANNVNFVEICDSNRRNVTCGEKRWLLEWSDFVRVVRWCRGERERVRESEREAEKSERSEWIEEGSETVEESRRYHIILGRTKEEFLASMREREPEEIEKTTLKGKTMRRKRRKIKRYQ